MTSTPSCPSACHYKAIFHNVYLMLPPISPPNVLSDEIHTVTSSVPRQTAAKCNSNSYLFFILAHFIANTTNLFPPIALQVYSFSSSCTFPASRVHLPKYLHCCVEGILLPFCPRSLFLFLFICKSSQTEIIHLQLTPSPSSLMKRLNKTGPETFPSKPH